MKSVSALILVCAFVCASAQFGVKGGSGSSSGSQGAGFKSFFPRFTPGSIQEKKEQLQFANVDDGSSSGFVQPVTQVVAQPVSQVVAQPVGQVVAQPVSQVVAQPVGQTFVQSGGQDVVGVVSDAAQGVLVPSSGAVSSFSQVPVSVVGSVVSQPQFVQSVPAFQSFVPTFQQAVQSVQSVPSAFAAGATKFFQPAERFVFENRQPAQLVQFDAPATGAGFPGFTQNIVHLSNARPQATFQTVPSFVSNSGSSGADFGPNFVTQVPQAVGKVVKQVSGSVVSQPLSSFASFPSTGSVAPLNFAKPSTQLVSAGKVFTDNRLSGFSGQQPAVISQEKQLADTVQTTEW